MKRRSLFGFIILFALFIGSYQIFFKPVDIILPPTKPLSVSDPVLQSLYGINTGSYSVKTVQNIELVEGDRTLDMSTYYPSVQGQFPLVLFSHGNFSNRNQYDALITHWVSHGYVVIAPDHLDSGGTAKGILAMTIHGKNGMLMERPKDLSFILDNLDVLASKAPEVHARIDPTNIAAAGHSFGAYSAQMLAGATAVHPKTKAVLKHTDSRIMAVVAISPPGRMFDMITGESWNALRRPQIVTTGTWDVEARFWPRWQLHAMSYENAPTGDNYLLVTEGADHYYGNLICRLDRDAAPQPDALKMTLSATTAFLDAYVKGDTEARSFLNSNVLSDKTQDFSVLTRR